MTRNSGLGSRDLKRLLIVIPRSLFVFLSMKFDKGRPHSDDMGLSYRRSRSVYSLRLQTSSSELT